MEVENNKCVICGLILNDDTVIVKERGLLKFIESSIARDDGKADCFKARAEIILHKTCRNTYNNPKCLEAEIKRKKKESEKVSESIVEFDFQNKCFFCEKDASCEFERQQKKYPSSSRILVGQVKRVKTKNSILLACTRHDDDWSKKVLLRIDKVNILEKNARYHYSCYGKFCHSYRAAGLKRGRPKSQANETAMDQVFKFIEERGDTVGTTKQGQIGTDKTQAIRHGVKCHICNNDIVGFRYTCVQCADFDLCGACEARQAHAAHYVLRIPGARPQEEVSEMLRRVRWEIARFASASPADTEDELPEEPVEEEPLIIKTEIKEEIPDPLQMDPDSRPHASNILEQSMLAIVKEEIQPPAPAPVSAPPAAPSKAPTAPAAPYKPPAAPTRVPPPAPVKAPAGQSRLYICLDATQDLPESSTPPPAKRRREPAARAATHAQDEEESHASSQRAGAESAFQVFTHASASAPAPAPAPAPPRTAKRKDKVPSQSKQTVKKNT